MVFQLTAPHGGRQPTNEGLTFWAKFQLTAPHGGRQGSGSHDCGPEGISTHGPTRGPTFGVKRGTVQDRNFNSRPHTGADHPDDSKLLEKVIFQLTAPHGGRHSQPPPAPVLRTFQLTAPHGGRQALRFLRRILSAHFNSRPHTGADDCSTYSQDCGKYFNSRPHTGADEITGIFFHCFIYFNSRPHTGADSRSGSQPSYQKGFQLTAPHGGRRLSGATRIPISRYFNSRPHTGADHSTPLLRGREKLFQLTAPHGGRPLLPLMVMYAFTFQLTAPHGGRRSYRLVRPVCLIFQLTAPHGGRRNLSGSLSPAPYFNSRPHTGADLFSVVRLIDDINFNSRPHTGADEARVLAATGLFTFQLTAPHGGRRGRPMVTIYDF